MYCSPIILAAFLTTFNMSSPSSKTENWRSCLYCEWKMRSLPSQSLFVLIFQCLSSTLHCFLHCTFKHPLHGHYNTNVITSKLKWFLVCQNNLCWSNSRPSTALLFSVLYCWIHFKSVEPEKSNFISKRNFSFCTRSNMSLKVHKYFDILYAWIFYWLWIILK